MSEVKWIKICTDIFDDEKIILIEAMPDKYAIITAWFKLLCLAGKQNNSGVFLLNDTMPYTDEMFATIFRMPLNTVRLALGTFEQFGMIEIVDGVVTIPKWGKHQNLDALERNREQSKTRMREYRKRQRLLSEAVTQPLRNVTQTDKEEEKEEDIEVEIDKNTLSSDYSDDFERFWAVYPKKVGKKEAYKAFKKANKPVQLLIAAVNDQLDSDMWTKENGRFIPNPATWLNQGRWDDQVKRGTSNPFLQMLEEENDKTGNNQSSVSYICGL